MSNLYAAVDVLAGRKSLIGDGTEVRRLLPQRVLRTIGAWCFLDHYGPDDVSASAGMQVPPHPHIGLQTASWLFDGLVLHRDSLGNEQLIRPGELNLMTSGRGIAHSEESPGGPGKPGILHGVQLWIALPRDKASMAPDFAHYPDLPVVPVPATGDDATGGARAAGARVTVVVGEFGGEQSPAVVHTPLVGLEVTMPSGGSVTLAAREDFEYGVVAADGPATVGAHDIEPGMLAYVPAGGSSLALSSAGPGRLFVIGGLPLGERLVMWWNFVARTAGEISAARDSWMAGDGLFGEVHGYDGAPLPAPPLPEGTLRPR